MFTLGILLLFKPPSCFASPQYIDMAPLPGTTTAAAPPAAASERLEELEKMRRDGTITPAEYDRYRKQILDSL